MCIGNALLVLKSDATERNEAIDASLSLGSWLSIRERRRQLEPWEHTVFETGHGADPVAGEGEDEEPDPVTDAGRVRK